MCNKRQELLFENLKEIKISKKCKFIKLFKSTANQLKLVKNN